jgi:hypothetical protein
MPLKDPTKIAKAVAASVVAVAAAVGAVCTVPDQPPAVCYQTVQVAQSLIW